MKLRLLELEVWQANVDYWPLQHHCHQAFCLCPCHNYQPNCRLFPLLHLFGLFQSFFFFSLHTIQWNLSEQTCCYVDSLQLAGNTEAWIDFPYPIKLLTLILAFICNRFYYWQIDTNEVDGWGRGGAGKIEHQDCLQFTVGVSIFEVSCIVSTTSFILSAGPWSLVL